MVLVSITKGEFILALIIMVSSISLLQIEYFTKVDAQEEETEVHFSDNFGEGFGGITDSEIGPDGYIHSLNWTGENIQNYSFLTFIIEYTFQHYFLLDILTGSMRCLPFEMVNSEYQSGC
jgi:hypothetical protein